MQGASVATPHDSNSQFAKVTRMRESWTTKSNVPVCLAELSRADAHLISDAPHRIHAISFAGTDDQVRLRSRLMQFWLNVSALSP